MVSVKATLENSVVRSFQVSKVFTENTLRISSMEFSSDGERLISCGEDDQIVMYDSERGELDRTINSKKYGVDFVRFANSKSHAIHASTKVSDDIRYLSLHDKKYIRYFTGHSQKVVSLCMSPIGNTFASGSLDKSIRLWDLRSPNCQGYISVMGRPVAAFDPEGLVLAAGINSETLKLFDLRSYDKGPFTAVSFARDKECDWTDLKFSEDGCIIVIPTNGTKIRLINASNCIPIQTLTGRSNTNKIPIEASFSPDSQYILSGSTDSLIHIWNIFTGEKVCVLNSNDPGPVQCVKFNPKYMMVASASKNMTFWLPLYKTSST